jgi:hypothetical protein
MIATVFSNLHMYDEAEKAKKKKKILAHTFLV